jgi:hypothetical protein
MSRKIKNFILKMFNLKESGKELEEKIEKENQNLIHDIIDYIMDKFDFLKNKNS